MGISHLAKLRNYLRKNKDSFTKSFLRIQLNMNLIALNENLDYLINVEKVVEIVNSKPVTSGFKKFQWKR